MLTLHIEAPTLAELRQRAVAALGLDQWAADPAPRTADAPEPERQTRTRKAPPAMKEPIGTDLGAEDTVQIPKGDSPPANDPPPADEPKSDVALGYEADVKPAVLKLAEAKGRDTVIALLKDWKVDTAKDVHESDYAAFLADIEKRKAA